MSVTSHVAYAFAGLAIASAVVIGPTLLVPPASTNVAIVCLPGGNSTEPQTLQDGFEFTCQWRPAALPALSVLPSSQP